MTTTLIRSVSVSSNVVSVGVDSAAGLAVGFPILTYGLGEEFDSETHTVSEVVLNETGTPDTVSWEQETEDIALYDTLAQLEVPVTWITATDVENFLGFTPTADGDIAYMDAAIYAAQQWAWRRRQQAGYRDHPSIVPDASAKQGTVLKAAMDYRERGSIDSFQTYESMPITAPVGSIGQVMSLLGLNRPAIA
jgi:hypothetical protein